MKTSHFPTKIEGGFTFQQDLNQLKRGENISTQEDRCYKHGSKRRIAEARLNRPKVQLTGKSRGDTANASATDQDDLRKED